MAGRRYRLSPLSIRDTANSPYPPLSGATVTVYLAGTSTLATCYADTTTGTALSGSQTTTSSVGYFEFFIDSADYRPTQKFKIVITKTGYSDVTYDNLDVIIPFKAELDVREFLPYGHVTDGSVDYATQLQSAIDCANTNNLSLFLHDIYASSAKLTIVRAFNDTIGFRMFGRGPGVSGIKYTGAASIGTLLDIDGTSSGYSLHNNLHDFRLDVTNAPASTIGLKINAGVWRSFFTRLMVTRDIPGGGLTGTGIYMGSGTASDAGCYDNKFNGLYVNNFSKNLHFQGTDLSGNTITDYSIDHSYISSGDYNLYVEYGLGGSANNTQYENAQTAGAYFANSETYVHIGGAIESSVGGAIGVSMDANTKSIIALCDFYNNAGGHFVHNGQVGHHYKVSSTGDIYPPGSIVRFDKDASYTSYLRFFKSGTADVHLQVGSAGNTVAFYDASNNELLRFDATNAVLDFLTSAGILRLRDGAAINFYQGGLSYSWSMGTGSPEGSVTARPGSLYTNLSGGASTTLYVKESGTGNTGWVAK